MFNFNWKKVGIAAGLSLSLVAAGCGSDEDSASEDTGSSDNGGGDVNYSEAVDYTITGIEPGAGVVKTSEKAVKEYDSLKGWTVQTSSSGAMATALGEAIENEEPIIVTGWQPHWMFSKYDMKYLEDPKGVFGEDETINTMVRKGLKEDMPNAYKFLDQFAWSTEAMNKIMLNIADGAKPADAAAKWVEAHPDKVAEWTKGVEKVDGKEIELVYVEWDSAVASNYVVKNVLESLGFAVTVTPIDNAIMWKSVANGEADATLAAWLPVTHADLYAEYKDQVVNLGKSLSGANIGLAVPAYMDIDSIEDLKPAE